MTKVDVGFNLAPQVGELPYRQVADIYYDGTPAWSEPLPVERQGAELARFTLRQRTAGAIIYYAQRNLVAEDERPDQSYVWCHTFATEAGQMGVGIASETIKYPEYPGLAYAAAAVTRGERVEPEKVRPGEQAVIGNPEGEMTSQGYQIAIHSLVGLGGDNSIQVSGNYGGRLSGRLFVGATSRILAWQREQARQNGDPRQLDLYTYRERLMTRIGRALLIND